MKVNAQLGEPAPDGAVSRRLLGRFHAAYLEAFGVALDLEEFRVDDFYAFRTLERALGSDTALLVRLAAWLHAQREGMLERITIGPADVLRSSLRGETPSRAWQLAVGADRMHPVPRCGVAACRLPDG